jgi:hypothetical protein
MADGTFEKIAAPAVTAAPAIALFRRKERRSKAFVAGEATSSPEVGFEFDRESRDKFLFFITIISFAELSTWWSGIIHLSAL